MNGLDSSGWPKQIFCRNTESRNSLFSKAEPKPKLNIWLKHIIQPKQISLAKIDCFGQEFLFSHAFLDYHKRPKQLLLAETCSFGQNLLFQLNNVFWPNHRNWRLPKHQKLNQFWPNIFGRNRTETVFGWPLAGAERTTKLRTNIMDKEEKRGQYLLTFVDVIDGGIANRVLFQFCSWLCPSWKKTSRTQGWVGDGTRAQGARSC